MAEQRITKFPAGILTDDKCACLDAVLESYARTKQLIEACRECGLDTSRAEAENEAQRELAQKIKARAFPDRP